MQVIPHWLCFRRVLQVGAGLKGLVGRGGIQCPWVSGLVGERAGSFNKFHFSPAKFSDVGGWVGGSTWCSKASKNDPPPVPQWLMVYYTGHIGPCLSHVPPTLPATLNSIPKQRWLPASCLSLAQGVRNSVPFHPSSNHWETYWGRLVPQNLPAGKGIHSQASLACVRYTLLGNQGCSVCVASCRPACLIGMAHGSAITPPPFGW